MGGEFREVMEVGWLYKFDSGFCTKCGKKLDSTDGKDDRAAYSKCIRCGLKYCCECWEPDFMEVCPKCGCGCS